MTRQFPRIGLTLLAFAGVGRAGEPAAERTGDPVAELLGQSCLDCHAGADPAAGLDLGAANARHVGAAAEVWENVVRKLRTGQMPPAEMPRPDVDLLAAALLRLEDTLDRAAEENPRPGRTATLRRLTVTEYQNAIRDLLALDIDATRWLPRDEVGHGFDNVTVGDLSPTRLDRYLTAAEQIARLALGRPGRGPEGRTVRLRPDLTQEERLPGLPPGTRGGVLIPHTFPRTGEYEVRVRLMRDRNEHVEGLTEPHTLDLLLDRGLIESFEVKPPRGRKGAGGGWEQPTHADVDRHLVARLRVAAGPHDVGVTFHPKGASLLESARQPGPARFNFYRHPRLTPAVYEVSITGPFDAEPDAGSPDEGPTDTPSRDRIFVCRPEDDSAAEQDACAERILGTLMRRAYRRPVTAEDFARPLALFRAGRDAAAENDDAFEAGLELALAGVLVNPNFLFRVERDPPGAAPGEAYAVGDVALASRLSFFLWAGPPDDELLALAERGELGDPAALDRQVRRMLADERAGSLTTNFAGQWLHLRNLDAAAPDMRLFPDFDDNLRQAFREETERLFAEVLRENRPVTDLLAPDHAWLNERLAEHYGVPHVAGARFRRVPAGEAGGRGGLLRQGSVLTVTSYATRTSPVLRGKWVLENLLGTPPAPPPPDIPALDDNTVAAGLPVRERLAAHRAHAACASCHDLIDPLGLTLEGFDAVGRRRELEAGRPVDATGGFPGAGELVGVAELERELLARPDLFASTLAEKLLVYALGRGLTHEDAPAVRGIVRSAAAEEYRSAALIRAVAASAPFRLRTAPPAAAFTSSTPPAQVAP